MKSKTKYLLQLTLAAAVSIFPVFTFADSDDLTTDIKSRQQYLKEVQERKDNQVLISEELWRELNTAINESSEKLSSSIESSNAGLTTTLLNISQAIKIGLQNQDKIQQIRSDFKDLSDQLSALENRSGKGDSKSDSVDLDTIAEKVKSLLVEEMIKSSTYKDLKKYLETPSTVNLDSTKIDSIVTELKNQQQTISNTLSVIQQTLQQIEKKTPEPDYDILGLFVEMLEKELKDASASNIVLLEALKKYFDDIKKRDTFFIHYRVPKNNIFTKYKPTTIVVAYGTANQKGLEQQNNEKYKWDVKEIKLASSDAKDPALYLILNKGLELQSDLWGTKSNECGKNSTNCKEWVIVPTGVPYDSEDKNNKTDKDKKEDNEIIIPFSIAYYNSAYSPIKLEAHVKEVDSFWGKVCGYFKLEFGRFYDQTAIFLAWLISIGFSISALLFPAWLRSLLSKGGSGIKNGIGYLGTRYKGPPSTEDKQEYDKQKPNNAEKESK